MPVAKPPLVTPSPSAKSITLSGDATGSVVYDGSEDATLEVTVVDNSHAHTIGNVTGLEAALSDINTDISAVVKYEAQTLTDTQEKQARDNIEAGRKPFANITALKAYQGGETIVELLGHTTSGDGGGGTYVWNASSSATVVEGVIVQKDAGGAGRWELVLWGNAIFPEQAGAFSTDANANPALQNIATYCADNGLILDGRHKAYTVTSGLEKSVVNRSGASGVVDVAIWADVGSNLKLKDIEIDFSALDADARGIIVDGYVAATQHTVQTTTAGPTGTTIELGSGVGANYSALEWISIRSTATWGNNGEDQQEIVQIASISSDTFTIVGYLQGNYAGASAVVEKWDTSTSLELLGKVKIVGGDLPEVNAKDHVGIDVGQLFWYKTQDLHVVNTAYSGHQVTSCLFTKIGKQTFDNCDKEGAGYGCVVIGGQFFQCGNVEAYNTRHPVSLGRNSSGYVMRWASVGNILGIACRDSVFDTHTAIMSLTVGDIVGSMKYGNGGDVAVTLEGCDVKFGNVDVKNCVGNLLYIVFNGQSDPRTIAQVGGGHISGSMVDEAGSQAFVIVLNADTVNNQTLHVSLDSVKGHTWRGVEVTSTSGAVNLHIGHIALEYEASTSSVQSGIICTANATYGIYATVDRMDAALTTSNTGSHVGAIYNKGSLRIGDGNLANNSNAGGLRTNNSRLSIGANTDCDFDTTFKIEAGTGGVFRDDETAATA